jgi:senataxin
MFFGQVGELRQALEAMSTLIGDTHKQRLECADDTGAEYATLTAALTAAHTKKQELGRRLGAALGEQRKTTTALSTARETGRMAILAEAEVVCATLTGSGVEYLAQVPQGFPTVIIDEAAQAVELATLIPLQYG